MILRETGRPPITERVGIIIIMAKKSVRQLNPKFPVRAVNRCFKCARARGYMRDFDLCRICFRELANEGKIPGIKKASW